jgi:EmrB/QacA subfamily drug resistance transporter
MSTRMEQRGSAPEGAAMNLPAADAARAEADLSSGGLVSMPQTVLLAAVLGTALAYMSDDMLNLAIPSVARNLQATVTDAQWILNAYYVALVSCVLAAGAIGDIVGHRRVFLGGIFIFATGAVLCAIAPAVWLIVTGRFVQGIGAAMLLAASLALVTYLSPPESRSSAVGRFLGLGAAVPAIGPFASGALIELLSWRWLFVVPLVLPVGALALTWLRVPETPRAAGRRPDLWGSAVAFVTLGAFSIALIEGAAEPAALLPVLAFTAALIGSTCFVLIERRVADPMLPLHFFQRRRFLAGNLVWLLGSMTCTGAVFFVAVLLQATLRQSPLVAGLLLTPIYLVMMVGSPLAGRIADRLGPRWPIFVGLGIYAAGLLQLSRIGPSSTVVPDVVVGILVFATGMALFTAPLATVTLSALDEGEQGVASGMNNAMGQLASLLAVAILPAIAGLASISFGDPAFAVGYGRALGATALIAITCMPIAAWAFIGSATSVGGRREDSSHLIQGGYRDNH